MLPEKSLAWGRTKSCIRELAAYCGRRKAEIGAENVFDFSLGNPSVPVPEAFNLRIKELLDHGDPMLVHGYSPSLGIPSVREKIAASLNRRFGMFPTEGYGLSNNPQVSGPPAFEDSAFEVTAPETAIAIELRY